MYEIITLKPGFTFYHTSIYNTEEAKEHFEFEHDMGDTPYGELDLHNSLYKPKYFALLDVFPYVTDVIKYPDMYGLSRWTTHSKLNLLVMNIRDGYYDDNLRLLEESGADGWLRYDDKNNLWYEAYILEPYKFFNDGEEIRHPSLDKFNYSSYPLEYRTKEMVKLMSYTL